MAAIDERRKCAEEARPGPRTAYAFLPWLLLGMGAFSNIVKGETPNPWIGGIGLLTFNSLYISVVFRAFDPSRRHRPATYAALGGMAVVTYGLGAIYGGSWLALFPLLSLACGTVLRGRRLAWTLFTIAGSAAAISVWRDLAVWTAVTNAYGALLSGMVTAALITLSEKILELRETRQELARTAVEKERLRFSRDLHDLLGHTLSVIVVKSEAARRLASRDLGAALAQVHDIESVGRQALNEIREAVTGYRDGSLATELDRARDALTAAGIEPVVRQSGPPLAPETAALLGWVVRESVTNVVRHSGAAHCELDVTGTPDLVRLRVTDDGPGTGALARAGTRTDTWGGTGPGPRAAPQAGSGLGLQGLAERLAAAGGTLSFGPRDPLGFQVTAQIPVGPGGSGGGTGDSGSLRPAGSE
ncbi:histidine kinase [Streptomyces monticola]|uniref:Histidine kinase n=1 Tax=Streptomyces monticola TaxID=2666263 RepID=A0ABW2JS64_9ACTN